MIILVFAYCNSNKTNTIPKDAPPVEVGIMVAQMISFDKIYEASGNVLPHEFVNIFPETAGKLTYLQIDEGSSVSQGTILAKINNAELVAQLSAFQLQADIYTKTEDRLRKLLDVNGVSQAEYDEALTKLNTAKANIKVIEAQIEKTIIRAPFSGVLGLRMVSNGAYVNPQTLLCTLQETSHLKVDFNIPQEYGGKLKRGSIVSVISQDKEYNAIVYASEPAINSNTGNQKIRAKIQADITPGSYAKVRLKEKTKGILVPTYALIPEATANKLVVMRGGKVAYAKVATGTRQAQNVEITSGILQGDTVIVAGVLFVRPNSSVKIKKVMKYKNYVLE
ncbi:MAG: efflux RND transporter periplasmic adaptor subunit [Cytophagales bacterium]|nr:efflux RND transporter periplasmic adaptor subunit [Cytophagales bacterium]